jgi:hypothetical protein
LNQLFGVMAGLVPAIHVLLLKARKKGVDARDKRGHDARVMAGCGFDRFHGIALPGTVTPFALATFRVGKFVSPNARSCRRLDFVGGRH